MPPFLNTPFSFLQVKMHHTSQRPARKSPQANIQIALICTYLLILIGRYFASTGISNSSSFSMEPVELYALTSVYLLQVIPLFLLKITRYPFFKICFLISQVIGLLFNLPGLGNFGGSEIYGSFIHYLNDVAAYTATWAICLHIYLFFYVRNRSIDALLKVPADKS